MDQLNISEDFNEKTAKKMKQQGELEKAKELSEKISNLTVELKGKSGENGKLFGSITTKDIAEALNKQHKVDIDKRKMEIEGGNIKTIGTTIVDIKVYPNVSAKLKVKVAEE